MIEESGYSNHVKGSMNNKQIVIDHTKYNKEMPVASNFNLNESYQKNNNSNSLDAPMQDDHVYNSNKKNIGKGGMQTTTLWDTQEIFSKIPSYSEEPSNLYGLKSISTINLTGEITPMQDQ